jgi:hypothetical protein
MSKYPMAVYKAPGDEVIDGKHFTSKVVADESEHDQALDDGWHESPADADEAHQKTVKADESKAADDQSGKPTRDELVQKAKELGIAFKPQTSDKKLLEAIEERLQSQASDSPAHDAQ